MEVKKIVQFATIVFSCLVETNHNVFVKKIKVCINSLFNLLKIISHLRFEQISR